VLDLAGDGRDPLFIEPDILLFLRGDAGNQRIYAQRIHPGTVRVRGVAIPISQPVRTAASVGAFAASGTGRLAYLPDLGDRGQLITDRAGAVLDSNVAPFKFTHQFARAKPLLASGGGAFPLTISDPTRSPPVQHPTKWRAASPAWGPGDSSIAYLALDSLASGIALLNLGTGRDTLVVDMRTDRRTLLPTSWSPDGRYLVYTLTSSWDPDAASIRAWDFHARHDFELVSAPALEGDVSPDGRWLAYRARGVNQTWELFVRPFLGAGEPRAISRAGGRSPRWRGRELFFQSPDGEVMVVDVDLSTAAPRFSIPRALFKAPAWSRHNFFDIGTPYDVSHDGAMFAVRISSSAPTAVLLQGWTMLLR
jgi:hypothetical protein